MIDVVAEICGGVVLLYAGAELLVRGSSALALRLKVSPLVIGMTIVAFGTSTPELFVSMKASLIGSGDIAIGNVIGSNICNVGLILGLSALIRPLRIRMRTIRMDVPIMIGSSLFLYILLLDRRLGRAEGILLTAGVIAFTLFSVWHVRRETKRLEIKRDDQALPSLLKNRVAAGLSVVIAGFAMLGFGADILINGAVGAAERLGVGQALVGLTVVAVGTSLPELATSTVASWKGQSDISVGNIIGSNIFNVLGILGLSSAANPVQGAGIRERDLVFMAGLALLVLPFMRTGFMMKRWEGAVLLAIYGAYIFVTVL